MKRILFLSHSASRTGAPLLLLEIAARLDAAKYERSFILGEDGPLRPRFEQIGSVVIDPIYPDEPRYWREIKRAGARLTVLNTLKPDMMYCNTIHPAKWLPYAKISGIPTLTHIHELSLGFATLGRAEHFMVRRFSDRIIAVSSAVGQYLEKEQRISRNTITVIHAGIPIKRHARPEPDPAFRHSLGLDGSIVVGMVGRITAMKGTDMVPRLVRMIREQYPARRIQFLFVATTDDRAALAAFDSALLNDGVEILRAANVPDPERYYSVMDIFLSTSREDPFPLVVLEAMASGLPVVGFRAGGIPEAVDETCGILIEPFDLDAMSAAIYALSGSADRRRAMGEHARSRVEQFFDLQKNIVRFEHVIDAMV